jgi:hypothetical protein
MKKGTNTKKGAVIFLCVLLIITAVMAGFVNKTATSEEAVFDNVKTKQKAIDTADQSLYMSTVTENDYYYRNEQLRWFTEMVYKGIKQVKISAEKVEIIDEETAIATIHQTHFNGEAFDFTWPALFRFEDGEWVDCGYAFEEVDTDKFTVKYMEGETRVNDFITMMNEAYKNLEPIFVERPHSSFELKLFSDRELLRQRTVPSVRWQFTGWGEPNESLKLYTGHPDINRYKGTVQHEVVHHITINICNNNLPVWLYEGVAMYYGSAYYGFENSKLLSSLKKEDMNMPISELEVLDSSILTETQDIYNWYGQNFMYTAYMIEEYGHDKYMELWYEAGKKPFNDSAANPNFYAQNNVTMEEVLMSVLGITKKQLTDDYLAWLEATDILENPPFG